MRSWAMVTLVECHRFLRLRLLVRLPTIVRVLLQLFRGALRNRTRCSSTMPPFCRYPLLRDNSSKAKWPTYVMHVAPVPPSDEPRPRRKGQMVRCITAVSVDAKLMQGSVPARDADKIAQGLRSCMYAR